MTALKPRTATIVLYQGDDMTRMAELRRAAENARQFHALAEAERAVAWEALSARDATAREGDDEAAASAAVALREKAAEAEAELQEREQEYDAFVDEAAERAVTVELHSIGSKRFRDLMAEHPPRKVTVKVEPGSDADEGAVPTEVERIHEDDAHVDVNTGTFPHALLTYIDPDDPEVRTIAKPEFTSAKAVTAFVDNDLADGDLDGMWTDAYWLNRARSGDPKASKYSAAPRSS